MTVPTVTVFSTSHNTKYVTWWEGKKCFWNVEGFFVVVTFFNIASAHHFRGF